MTGTLFNVLFLCTGNSARSIMAECILNREGKGRFRAFSAGSHPKGSLHPETAELLRNLGYDLTGLRSKSWDEFAGPDAPVMDFVFTVCDSAAGEMCPVWPSYPMNAHWGVPDPAALSATGAERALELMKIYGLLYRRITLFTSLRPDVLERLEERDRRALQQQLNQIGTVDADSTVSL